MFFSIVLILAGKIIFLFSLLNFQPSINLAIDKKNTLGFIVALLYRATGLPKREVDVETTIVLV